MTLSRRAFALSALTAPAATAMTLSGSGSAQAQTPKALPPTARIRIGRYTVTFLTDGYAEMPYGFLTGVPAEEIEAAARARFADRPGGQLRLSFIQYLIDDGERLILVDTGPAGRIGDATGRLPSALDAVGIAPEDIDAVILTHTHFDHISGAIAGNRAVFPNAEVYVDRRDIAYFTDPAKKSAAPDFLQSSFDTTALLVDLYPRLQQIEGDHRILPGIETVDLTGHTPGHIGVRISDAGQSLMLVSDMLFHPVAHPERADVGFVFEQDPAAALAMRERFFPMAEGEGLLISATHMPFPGLGRIVSDRGARRWIEAEWAYEA